MDPVTANQPERACIRCLYVDGMGLDFLPSVLPRRLVVNMRIDDDGVCSLCHAYARAFDAAKLARERAELLEMTRAGPVVVALSGGKDSLSTLWLTRTTLGLAADRVRAVLLDNGFIPGEVVDVARAACAKLDVHLGVARLDDASLAAFAGVVTEDDATRELPCSACSRHLERALLDVARDVHASALVTGTNFFASWGVRPSAFTSTRGALKQAKLPVVHLPYMLGVKRADVEKNLDALGVRPVRGLPGSTNCRVPGLLQARATARGHTVDVEDKLLEVLVGHLGRDEALV